MSLRDTLNAGLTALQDREQTLTQAGRYMNGEQSAVFLSPKSKEALDGKLPRLGVNYPRLVVRSRVERLKLTGFTTDGTTTDARLWSLFRRAGLVPLSDMIHADYLGLGSSYVTVWPSVKSGSVVATATADNGRTMHVATDPASGETKYAVRRWTSGSASHAVLIQPDAITTFRCDTPDTYAGPHWSVVGKTLDNPLQVVPVVPFIRRETASDKAGRPAVADLYELTDAHAKVLADSMVGSEYFARPRRWATGLEIVEDDDGNPIDPFGEGRFLQSEDPETKFGQLDGSRADGYTDLLAVLTQSIGALSGLPGHYLGLNGEQPPNADSVRAAEAQLVSLSYADQRQLDQPWSAVAALLHVMDNPDGLELDALDLAPVWASPEARTPAQSADAAAKLAGIGVPLRSLLADPLGYRPDQIRAIMDDQRSDAIQRAGLDLTRVLP